MSNKILEHCRDCVDFSVEKRVINPIENRYISHPGRREEKSDFNIELIDKYLNKVDWEINENSNMSYSIQGLNNYIASELSKNYWLNKVYPEKIKLSHESGDIHIHDLNMISVYCVGWDLKELLLEGFKGVEGKVESRAAKHFRVALGQIVNFMYTMQGEAAGAQAFSNFDTLLAPFIRFDKLNYVQVKQAMQEFVFNMNIPTRVGFQAPFTNITLDLKVPSYYKDHPVIIGGEMLENTYKEFQEEMDMLNRAFFEVMLEADSKGQVFTFPIPTYNIVKDFDWDNQNLNGLWQMAAKYGIPYFSNFVNSDMSPEDARSMCCRLRIDNRELEYRGSGLFGSNPLTGSIGVVTINLPRIGKKAVNKADFFELLEKHMETAKESLEIKRELLERYTDRNLYPYTKFYLRDIKSRYGVWWKNHFSTIGLIGMNEACLNFLNDNIGSKRGKGFALEVMDFMREKIVEFQVQTGNNYNLEATPAEGASYRLARLDNSKFPYYTNSTHLPVDYSDDIFEVLDIQDELQTKYTGGTVVHIYSGQKISDIETLKNLVKKVCENYKLPYFTFCPTFSICKTHGYISSEHFKCPKCGKECQVYSRIVGYIRPIQQWNQGKKIEFKNRKTFLVD